MKDTRVLENFAAIAGALDTKKSIEEIVGAMEQIAVMYRAIKADTEQERAARDAQFAALKQSSARQLSEAILHIKNGKDGKDGARGERGAPGERGESIRGEDGDDGENGKDGSPDSADDIRNKLELLTGHDRLTIDAIDGLKELLAEMDKKLIGARSGGSTVFAQTRGAVKIYDLSDQLNGVTKTFALPSFGLILDVKASSSAQPMLQGVEYTVDGQAMTLTFTSEIDASTTLSNGQRIVILYAEN